MFKDKIRMMLIYAKRKPIDGTRGMRAKGCQHFKGGLRLWAYLPIQYPILSMFSGGLRIKNVCSTLFPAVSVRSALVVFHLAFHDSINVNANFRKVVENADDAVHHLNGNSLRLC